MHVDPNLQFRFWGSGFRVWGLGFTRTCILGFMVCVGFTRWTKVASGGKSSSDCKRKSSPIGTGMSFLDVLELIEVSSEACLRIPSRSMALASVLRDSKVIQAVTLSKMTKVPASDMERAPKAFRDVWRQLQPLIRHPPNHQYLPPVECIGDDKDRTKAQILLANRRVCGEGDKNGATATTCSFGLGRTC